MAETFDSFIKTYARERDLTDERASYTGATASPSHVVEDRLPDGFEERKACARYPDQVVWSSDAELGIVVWTALGEKGRAGRLVMEVWSSPGRYHARLDDLAGVPA